MVILPLFGIYISQLVRFARCCTSIFDFILKSSNHFNSIDKGLQISKASETFRKFFRSYSQLLSKFGAVSFQEYVSKGITHSVFYGDLVYKLRRFKGKANFISSGSKIVKRLWHRQYDPEIRARTIGLVLGPFTSLYRSFLQRCTLTKKAVGTIWRALSNPTATGSWSPSLLIVSLDTFSFWTWARLQTTRSTAYFNGCH